MRAPGGYAWWYLDALSAEGDGLVCILLVGSVFSPLYAARLRRGEIALPEQHCAVNLALYRGGRQVTWVMHEYPGHLALDDDRVAIGGTVLERQGERLRLTVDERATPFFGHRFGARVQGTITVESQSIPYQEASLTVGGRTHAWQALAPRAQVTADFPSLGFAMEGPGYHDRNHGDGRLEEAFTRWGWVRRHGRGRTDVAYSFTQRDGTRHALWVGALDDDGATPREGTPLVDGAPRKLSWGMSVPSTWGVDPAARAGVASVLRCAPTVMLEQTPFYARFRARLTDEPDTFTMGEWLDLERFSSRWNQFLIGFKTRRT